MKFRVEDAQGIPIAVFEDEPQPKSWLLSSFLEEARVAVEDFLGKLDRVRRGEVDRAGCTGDGVDIVFYPDHVVIEELYPSAGGMEEPQRVEISVSQARQLLSEWRAALENWRQTRSRG